MRQTPEDRLRRSEEFWACAWVSYLSFWGVVVALILIALILNACASQPPPPPEPITVIKEVDRIVQVRCADMRPAAPDFPDDDDELAAIPAEDIFGLAQIYRAARTLYRQRLREDDDQIRACAQ